MGFGKYKNEKTADLVHKIELFDLVSGDPAMAKGRRQYLTVMGSKSLEYKKSIDSESAQNKRRNKTFADLTVDENIKTLARRLSILVVSAYIDVSETDEPDLIEFSDISKLSGEDRDKVQLRLRNLFAEVVDLAVMVNEEVSKSINFLPGRGQTLSSLLNKESGTEQPQREVSTQE